MKTTIIHMLAEGMCAVEDKALFPSVKITTLNPKSVTYGQLYGTFDQSTREWCEGIASNYVRAHPRALPAMIFCNMHNRFAPHRVTPRLPSNGSCLTV